MEDMGSEVGEPSVAQRNEVVLHFSQGRLPEAETLALALTHAYPQHPFGWKALGAVLRSQGRLQDALMPMRKAAALAPRDFEAWCNLGVLLIDAGQYAAAERCLLHAVELKHSRPEAHAHLAVVYRNTGRLVEAEARLRAAIAANPAFADAHNNLGNLLKDLGRLGEAIPCYQQALRLKPDYAEAWSNLLFSLNYSAQVSPPVALKAAQAFGQWASTKVSTAFTAWRCETPPQRLRVGLVSGDLHAHPVGFFLDGVLKHLDRSRIELYAYPTHGGRDALTERLQSCCNGWTPIHGLTDAAAAERIHAAGIHVLIDLAGHTAHNRLPVFAWKPAPAQVSWLGYFATTGLPQMDYVLADEISVPTEHAAQFVERVWRLPETRLCFTPPDTNLPVAPLPALTHGHFTFGCFQNLAKVGDEVFRAWALILKAVPGARLRLQNKQLDDEAVRTSVLARMQQSGIEPVRVSLHGQMSREAYLAAHAEVDVLLDTFPYPGGTTTCEALWMGVPTVTLAGNTMISRQGASLLAAAGLADWVAVSVEAYVAKAIAHAEDLEGLAHLRGSLRRQVAESALFDGQRFARHLQKALWGMWEARGANRR